MTPRRVVLKLKEWQKSYLLVGTRRT